MLGHGVKGATAGDLEIPTSPLNGTTPDKPCSGVDEPAGQTVSGLVIRENC
jgi:hypothetical protein